MLLNQFIYDKLDTNFKVIGLFIDIKQAFDCVNYKILLKQLYYCNFRVKICDLLKY